jgi:hypothetical protein
MVETPAERPSADQDIPIDQIVGWVSILSIFASAICEPSELLSQFVRTRDSGRSGHLETKRSQTRQDEVEEDRGPNDTITGTRPLDATGRWHPTSEEKEILRCRIEIFSSVEVIESGGFHGCMHHSMKLFSHQTVI